MRKILVCIICMMLFVACASNGSKSSSSTSPTGSGSTPTPNPAAPPGNFLYSGSIEAIFLAWVNTNGNLSGQTQDARLQSNNDGSTQVKSTHGSFTGVLTNGQVSLIFGGFLGWSNTVTGTYDGTTLTLNLPTQNGGIGSFAFVPATNTDFNNAVSALQTTAGNANATVTTVLYQATADANATMTTQSQQQAVANANASVGNDLSTLQGYISDLNQAANFDSVFSAYAQTWQQMQNDYQTEVNDSRNGCGDGGSNYGTVQSDAGTVQSDEGSIQSDDGSYDSQKASIDGPYGNVQSLQATLKSDWQTLQQAVANNPSGTPGSNYSQSDIDQAIASGNNALSNADSIVQKAKQERATYDNEANDLNSKAQALPGKMGC